MISDDLAYLFQEFGKTATVERTGQSLDVVFNVIDEETRMGTAEFQNITASILIRPTDKLKTQHHDNLLIEGEHYRIERTYRQPSGLIKCLLSEAENRDEYIHFTI